MSPTQILNHDMTDSSLGMTNYNKEKKEINCDDIKALRPKDSLQVFLKKAFLEESYRNSVIIGHGKNYLNFVYKSFFALGIEPNKVVKKSQKIIRIITEVNNLSFVNADAFLLNDFKNMMEADEKGIFLLLS